MTGQERDYEAILSHVLHTTADQVEPVGDGLTKIRERLSEPWLKRQWWLLRSELMMLRWFVVVRCESFFSKIRSRSDVTDLTPDESRSEQSADAPMRSLLSMATPVSSNSKSKKRQRSIGPAMAWLRPAFAVAGAVVLVVAGVFALGNIQQGFGFIGLGSDTGTSQPGNSSQTGQNGNTQGGGNTFSASGGPSRGHSATPSPGTSAAHSRTLPSPGPCVSPPPPPVSSPTPSASPTSSPTTSPTSSPTPTPTSSPTTSPSQAPNTSGIVGHPPKAAIGTTALVICEQTAGASPSPSPSGP